MTEPPLPAQSGSVFSLEKVFRALPHVILVVDRSGQILELNHAPDGGSRDAWRGVNLATVFVPNSRASFIEALQRVGDQRAESLELPLELKRWWELQLVGLGEHVLVTAADITARRLFDARRRALLEALPDLLFVIDREGRFRDFLGAPGRTLAPPKEFLGQPVSSFMPPPVAELTLAALSRAFAERQPQQFVYHLSPNEGRLESFEARLVPYSEEAAVAVVRDVTAENQAVKAVERSEVEFRRIMESLPDAVWVHEHGRLSFVNPAAALLLGFDSPAELLGLDGRSMIHPDDRALVNARLDARQAGQKFTTGVEIRLFRRDGSLVWIETAAPQKIRLGGREQDLVVGRDITQRKLMHAQLLASERVAGLGRLAASVAQELNNPLSYMLANLTMVARGLTQLHQGGPVQLGEMIKAIGDARSGAERLRHLVSDLATFSELDRADAQTLDLKRVVDAAVNLMASELRQHARFFRSYGDVPPVRANETRLGQVVLSLLANAVSALGDATPFENRIEVSTATDARGWAILEVGNSGPHLPADAASHLWEPFFSGALGSGLWVCKQIVEGVGGQIDWRPDPRGGSIFRVALPAAAESVEALAGPSVEPLESTGVRAQVLVVDPEPVIATMVQRALSGLDVYGITSGRDALELCKAQPFDIVLYELSTLDLPGMQMHAGLRAHAAGAEGSLIFMSSGSTNTRVKSFLASIDNQVLLKPFDVDELRKAVFGALLAKV